MAAARRKAILSPTRSREASDASSAPDTDFGRLESQQMMAYAKAVSGTSQREKFASDFRAQVERDGDELVRSIDEQLSSCNDDRNDAELLTLIGKLRAGCPADGDAGEGSMVALAEATLRRCRDLIQLYHDIDVGVRPVPEAEQSNQGDDEEGTREVQRLLGLGKHAAFARVRRAVGVEDEETDGEGVIDHQKDWERLGAVFKDEGLEAHVREALSSAEKGVKRMLKFTFGDFSAE